MLRRDGVDLLDDDLLEKLLHLGVGILVLGPGHQAAVAEAMEQVIDRLEAHLDAEFLLEDPLDVESPQGANIVLGTGQLVQALLQPGVLLRVQPWRTPATRSLVEGLDPPAIVLGDPILDGLERASQGLGDVLCGPSLFGQDDGLDAAPESLLGNRLDDVVELFCGMVIGDEHG